MNAAHKPGACEVLVHAYRKDIKAHEARWEPGEVVDIVAANPDEDIEYRIDVRPTNKPGRFYRACHPDCVRMV